MTVDQKILQALSGFGDPVYPGQYQGNSKRYYTFDIDTVPGDFADDWAQHEINLVTVHFYCPADFNCVSRIRGTKRKLAEEGFTWPSVERENDKNGQHVIFECEMEADLDGNIAD